MTDATLRPWQPEDAPDVLAAFDGDGMWSQGVERVTSVDDAVRWIEAHPWEPAGSRAALAIVVDGRAVGNVLLSSIDRRHGCAWVSYWVAEPFRGRGLASRAAATLATWALTEGGLDRLELGHRSNNPGSGRVAVAAGFVREGVQRAKLRYGDERFDVDAYARLATDPVPTAPSLPMHVPPPGVGRAGAVSRGSNRDA